MALYSVLNAEEDNDYAMAGKLDAQCTYLPLHCIPDTLIKLLVNCKFSTALVDDMGVNSPTVDVYSFMPQLGNSDEVSRSMWQGDYEDNKVIMGQVEIHLMKKKLSATKLGKLEGYDDVIHNIINLMVINLAVETLLVWLVTSLFVTDSLCSSHLFSSARLGRSGPKRRRMRCLNSLITSYAWSKSFTPHLSS